MSKIFSIAYRCSSGTIRGTNFNHRDSSDIYKSPQNIFVAGRAKTSKAVLARPIAEAITALYDGSIKAVGLTETGKIYVEVSALVDKSKIYQIITDGNDVIQMFCDKIQLDEDTCTRINFIPLIFNMLEKQIDKDFSEFVDILKHKKYQTKNNLVFDINVPEVEEFFFRANDHFYFANKDKDFEIIVEKCQDEIKKDLTMTYLGYDGEYKYVKAPKIRKRKTTSKKKDSAKTSSKFNIPQLTWSEELPNDVLSRIPSYDDYYFNVFNEEIEVSNLSMATGDTIALLLEGPAGTGKTTLCKLFCQNMNLPLYSVINCTNSLDEFTLGKFIPSDNGGFTFFKSEFTEAIEKGYAVVLEEINFAKPENLSFLNSLLDDNEFVRLDNGEVIKRHPNFRLFATCNPGYDGTQDLNLALKNRFNEILEVENISNEEIVNKLVKETVIEDNIAEDMVLIYNKISNKLEAEQIDAVISARNLVNWAKKSKYISPLKAATTTIVNPIAGNDKELREELIEIIKMKF